MNEDKHGAAPKTVTAKAQVRTKKGISIVWLVPLIALAIGGWLSYKSISEEGPLITIRFETADGLEAGKTKLKYNDVVVGEVEDIRLAPDDLSGVLVMARMEKDTVPYLTDKTRFWVVRATISAGEVSALGTLLSGAYIGIDPIKDGKPVSEFNGLEKRPLITAKVPGRRFVLQAPVLGSLNIGSPVFYRQIKVGEVVDYDLDENGDQVDIKVYIFEPHDKRISTATKFWNASGIDVSLDATGIKVDTQSLVSILQGGIAFETPKSLDQATEAPEDHKFDLHPDRETAHERIYTKQTYYLMYFDQSVRGLVPGAPVEFRGIQIGEVVDVKLIFDVDSLDVKIPVLVKIEPERIEIVSGGVTLDHESATEEYQDINSNFSLVDHGLRAQLKTGNLLTGQLYVELDIFPDAEPAKIRVADGYNVFPTVPSALGQITDKISALLKKIEAIPFKELGVNLNETLVVLKGTLEEYKGVAGDVDQKVLPKLDKTLVALQETILEVKGTFGADSALSYKAEQAMEELSGTLRSVRAVADQLDRNPRALLFGRGEGEK